MLIVVDAKCRAFARSIEMKQIVHWKRMDPAMRPGGSGSRKQERSSR